MFMAARAADRPRVEPHGPRPCSWVWPSGWRPPSLSTRVPARRPLVHRRGRRAPPRMGLVRVCARSPSGAGCCSSVLPPSRPRPSPKPSPPRPPRRCRRPDRARPPPRSRTSGCRLGSDDGPDPPAAEAAPPSRRTGVVAGRQARHLRPLDAGVGAGVRADRRRDRRPARRRATRRRWRWSPYTEWYENSLRFPDSPVARHHRELYGDRPYAAFAADWEAGLSSGTPTTGPPASRPPAPPRRARRQAPRRLLPVAHRGHRSRTGRAGTAARDVVGELAEAVRGAGMRFGVYYSGGFDWTLRRPADRRDGRRARGPVPRGDYPAYADAHVRELIDRYRPSVLWNDIAWPAAAERLGRCSTTTTSRCPTAS